MEGKSISDYVEDVKQIYHTNYTRINCVASGGNSLDYPEDERYVTNLLSNEGEEDDPFQSQVNLIDNALNKDEMLEAIDNAKKIIRNYKSLELGVIESITDSLSLIEKITE